MWDKTIVQISKLNDQYSKRRSVEGLEKSINIHFFASTERLHLNLEKFHGYFWNNILVLKKQLLMSAK